MNVKPGDFARIVAPHKRAGVLLTVGERLGDMELLGLMVLNHDWRGCGPVWVCKLITASTGAEALAFGKAEKRYLLPGAEVCVADKYLRRIDPEAEPETIQQLQEATA